MIFMEVLSHIYLYLSRRDGKTLGLPGHAWTGFILSKMDSMCLDERNHFLRSSASMQHVMYDMAMIISHRELSAAGFMLWEVFPENLRPRRTANARVARSYGSLRVWVPNGSCYQWMMTLSLVHGVGECISLYFGARFLKGKNDSKYVIQSPKKETRARPALPDV